MALRIASRDLLTILSGNHPDWPNGLSRDHQYWVYNSLDGAVTVSIHDKLQEAIRTRNTPHAQASYDFVRAMQGPALDIMRRGIAVNAKVRQDETTRYQSIRDRAQARLDALANAVWGPETVVVKTKVKEVYTPLGKRGQPLAPRERTVTTETTELRPLGLNPGSAKQVLAFFNVALGFPVEYEIRKTAEGSIRTPSANDKALRKWANKRLKGPGIDSRDRTVPNVQFAKPIVDLILAVRDADKSLAVLRAPLDPDGRMRCSYNVVGTESGRWSSSKNAFGRGTQLQNITPTMRRMFCADDGWRMISTDLEQAESRVVAGLVWQYTGDRRYLDACISVDLHTTASAMSYPELPWTDDPKENRRIADLPCPDVPGFSYRDTNKRFGHSANYVGSPYGVAQAVGVPVRVVEAFQDRYFTAFPAIREWHALVKAELHANLYLDTPLLRRRYFFSRPTEDSTLREAIAFVPQSTVAELLNAIMLKCWQRSLLPPSDPLHIPLQLLLQNHDAFAFQTPMSAHLPTVIAAVNSEFTSTTVPFTRGDERLDLAIPGEFVTGWNWAYADVDSDPSKWSFPDSNPDGLRKWKGADERTRTSGASPRASEWLNAARVSYR